MLRGPRPSKESPPERAQVLKEKNFGGGWSKKPRIEVWGGQRGRRRFGKTEPVDHLGDGRP